MPNPLIDIEQPMPNPWGCMGEQDGHTVFRMHKDDGQPCERCGGTSPISHQHRHRHEHINPNGVRVVHSHRHEHWHEEDKPKSARHLGHAHIYVGVSHRAGVRIQEGYR